MQFLEQQYMQMMNKDMMSKYAKTKKIVDAQFEQMRLQEQIP